MKSLGKKAVGAKEIHPHFGHNANGPKSSAMKITRKGSRKMSSQLKYC